MKKFKGVIVNWKKVDGRAEGTALHHVDGMSLESAMMSARPGAIANGQRMYTSSLYGTVFAPVGSDFEIIETQNSYYVLLGKEQV